MKHSFRIRVYYEDTDLAGIVYYANYLKFIERARSEMVRDLGIDQAAMRRDRDIVFAVRRVEAEYLAPALFDDLLEVRTEPAALTGAKLVLKQEVLREDRVLYSAMVTLVALGGNGRPARMPAEIRRVMG